MTDEPRDIRFNPTSAFVHTTSVKIPQPEEIRYSTGPSPVEDFKQIEQLLEDALLAIEDEKAAEALGPVEGALEIVRKHV